MMRSVVIAGVLLAVISVGCGEEPCAPAGGIVPGKGVSAEGHTVCIGASSVNQAALTGDFGLVGISFSVTGAHLTGMFSNSDGKRRVTAVTLHSGAESQTKGGVGIGSNREAVRGEFGEPVVDPFAGAWWYRQKGIVFEFEGDAVIRIQLFEPD